MAAWAIGPLRVRNGQTLIAQSRTRRLRSLSLPEPHLGTAAILGDELDACLSESAAHGLDVVSVGNPRNNRPDLLDPVKDDLFDQ